MRRFLHRVADKVFLHICSCIWHPQRVLSKIYCSAVLCDEFPLHRDTFVVLYLVSHIMYEISILKSLPTANDRRALRTSQPRPRKPLQESDTQLDSGIYRVAQSTRHKTRQVMCIANAESNETFGSAGLDVVSTFCYHLLLEARPRHFTVTSSLSIQFIYRCSRHFPLTWRPSATPPPIS